MLDSDNIFDTAEGLKVTLTLDEFNQLRTREPYMKDLWPAPTRITLSQEPPAPYTLNDVFPTIIITLEYDRMHLVKDAAGLAALATKIKDQNITEMCLGMDTFIADDVNVYLVPWLTLPKQSYARSYQEPVVRTIWSSLDLDARPILGLMTQDEMFTYPASLKYTMSDTMGETTSVLRIYHLRPASTEHLLKYPNLIYKHQDGRTHIWMNAEVVVKLSFHPILAQHEIAVLKLNLPGLPRLLESWIDGDEYFMVMDNCGTTLSDQYVFEALIPPEIKTQQLRITDGLRDRGFHHLDDHLNNYVIKDGKITLIDAEVIVNIDDFNAFGSKNLNHNFFFPSTYYRTISQSQVVFGATFNPIV
jgi:hypothetical protein